LGDAGTRAILEFVGKNDRVRKIAQKPSFDADVDSSAGSETDVQPVETPAAESSES
jgi:large subunit ribosomal protein L17